MKKESFLKLLDNFLNCKGHEILFSAFFIHSVLYHEKRNDGVILYTFDYEKFFITNENIENIQLDRHNNVLILKLHTYKDGAYFDAEKYDLKIVETRQVIAKHFGIPWTNIKRYKK